MEFDIRAETIAISAILVVIESDGKYVAAKKATDCTVAYVVQIFPCRLKSDNQLGFAVDFFDTIPAYQFSPVCLVVLWLFLLCAKRYLHENGSMSGRQPWTALTCFMANGIEFPRHDP